MTTNLLPALMEPDDLLRRTDGGRYELIDGVPREKGMGARSDEIAGLLLTALNGFIRPAKLGRAYPSQTGYRCFPGRAVHVRFPDVSFVPADRLPDGRSPDGYFTIPPALAVEVLSPNDSAEELEEKVGDYRSAGVKLVWVISPGSRTVVVRRLDRTAAELDETGTLSGEDVVPGFACTVADLFV